MYSIALTHDAHTRRYRVTPSQPSGWELTMSADQQPIRRVHFEDWHRVERALVLIEREVRKLREDGWHVEQKPGAPPA